MKAAVFEGIGNLSVREVKRPECGRGDVVLRVEACTICGTDLKIFRFGHPRVKPPQVIGHEISGVVVEAGADVERYRTGDRVAVAPGGVGCGTCYFCRNDLENLCTARSTMGYDWPGGFAEFVRIPERMVHAGNLLRTPDGIGHTEAALSEPLGCVLNAHEELNVRAGESVAILGAGAIGVLHALVCLARRAEPVFLIDVSQERLDCVPDAVRAMKVCSADRDVREFVAERTDGRGADAVIVAAPAPAAQQQSFSLCRRGGRISFFAGLPQGTGDVAVSTNALHYNEYKVFGTYGARRRHAEAALKMLSERAVDGRLVVTDTVSLSDIEAGFSRAGDMRGLKVAVACGPRD